MAEQNCGNCAFMRKVARKGSRERKCQCRRHPPRLVGASKGKGHWPIVADRAWCGEWKPRDGDRVDAQTVPRHDAFRVGDVDHGQ